MDPFSYLSVLISIVLGVGHNSCPRPSLSDSLFFTLWCDGAAIYNVQVGRLCPALPNHIRVTVGTKAEMETLFSPFRRKIAQSTAPFQLPRGFTRGVPTLGRDRVGLRGVS